jgi:hypothetical protein
MTSNLFVGDINSQNLITIQNWCGSPLDQMKFLDSYEELVDCEKKIIIVDAKEANHKFDLTKKIVDAGNYLLLMDLSEVVSFATVGLENDLPMIKPFLRILGGINDEYCLDTGNKIKNNKKLDFNLDSFYFLTHTDTNVMKSVNFTISHYLGKKTKPYKFLFLNGTHRPHRKSLWKILDQKNLLDRSLCSYLNSEYRKNVYPDSGIPTTRLPVEYDTKYLGLDLIPKLKHDDRHWKVFKHDFWRQQWVDGHIIPEQYIDTYFTVVTESWVNRPFLTEKTFKPLLAGHPFLILSAPGHYEYLHELGFKTFDGIIDERFAYEPNLDRKIEMVSAEIERLCNIDLEQFLEDVKPICEHNQRHYANGRQDFFLKKHFELQEFFKRVEQDACDFFNKTGRYSHGTV